MPSYDGAHVDRRLNASKVAGLHVEEFGDKAPQPSVPRQPVKVPLKLCKPLWNPKTQSWAKPPHHLKRERRAAAAAAAAGGAAAPPPDSTPLRRGDVVWSKNGHAWVSVSGSALDASGTMLASAPSSSGALPRCSSAGGPFERSGRTAIDEQARASSAGGGARTLPRGRATVTHVPPLALPFFGTNAGGSRLASGGGAASSPMLQTTSHGHMHEVRML